MPRDASRSRNHVESLVARGRSIDAATAEATKPYVQRWRRCGGSGSGNGDWEVTTLNASASATGSGSDRCIVYALGEERSEEYFGKSTIFGDASAAQPVTLRRRTAWLPTAVPVRPDAPGHTTFAHTTWSRRDGTDAIEITSRYVRAGQNALLREATAADSNEMVVTRTFLGGGGKAPVVSEEIFVRWLASGGVAAGARQLWLVRAVVAVAAFAVAAVGIAAARRRR